MVRAEVGSWLRLVAIALAILAADNVAWARNFEGCPPNRQLRETAFGYAPDPSSALGPARIGVAFRASQMSIPGETVLQPAIPDAGMDEMGTPSDPATLGAWIGVLSGHARLNLGPITFGGRFGGSLQTKHGEYTELGNVIGTFGLRRTGLAFGDALRVGVALQGGFGFSLEAKDHERDKLNRLAVRSPYETAAFAYDRPIVGALELRAEMVGCYAPFLHLRIDAVGWRADPERRALRDHDERELVLALPVSLAIGFDGVPGGTTWGAEVGLEFRWPESLLLQSPIGRVRVFADRRVYGPLHANAYLGMLNGDVDGIDLGTSLEAQW